MKTKYTYHSAITGKFVSKEYAEANPDITVMLSNCDLRQELNDFMKFIVKSEAIGNFVNEYLKQR